MTDREALISLNMVADIGSIRLNRLLAFFGRPQDILKANSEKLILVSGIGNQIAAEIAAFSEENLTQELDLARKFGLKILTYQDSGYPDNLKNIFDPPIVIYVKGEIRVEDNLSVAIVGSRKASFYGLSSAQRFAEELANLGFTIVSGMARGIDTYAHQGALKAGGRTIAVIGSGFNHIYPQENLKLVEKIACSGAVISEFPIGTLPLKQNFPRRNRVISGLAQGVLVAEAAKNSGALITADFALEQGREVFALPGQVGLSNSFGTNKLIQQGAKLVTDITDIIEELRLVTECAKKIPKRSCCVTNAGVAFKQVLPPEEDSLYNLIKDRAVILDDILNQSAIAVPKAYALLFKLQAKKLIRQLPGKQFIRSGYA